MAPRKKKEEVEETALAETDANELSTEVLEQLTLDNEEASQIAQASNQNFDPATEQNVARVAIMQPLSPEISAETPGYSVGQLINNQTRQVISSYDKAPWLISQGVDPANVPQSHFMMFIAIFKLPVEYVKWIPKLKQKSGETPFEWKTLDRNETRVKEGIWRAKGGTFKGRKPPVTDNTNYLILPIHHETFIPICGPIVSTFSRTSAKCGSVLISEMNNLASNRRPSYAAAFYLSMTKEFHAESNSHYVVINLAKGPGREIYATEHGPKMLEQIVETAKYLSDPDEGRERQEDLLNAAQLVDDEHSESQEGDVPDEFSDDESEF